jgi:hypothetical protein
VPSRKQRRRREKLKRHEYEYVLETEEGEEIPLESAREAREAREGKATDARSGARKPAKAPVDRRGRTVPEPSFNRVLKRSAIFTPLIAIFIYWTSSDDANFSVAQLLFTVVLLLAFFMPFSYLVDVLVYRMAMRRQQQRR